MHILHGMMLVDNQDVIDETPEMWPYGPTFSKVHKASDAIRNGDVGTTYEEAKANIDLNAYIKMTVDTLGKNTTGRLLEWSHRDGTPWHTTKKVFGEAWGREIPKSFIVEYFSKFDTNQ